MISTQVLALGDFMHFPYARVAAAGRVVPAPLLECAYDAFARRRLAWYGRLPAGAAGVAVVDAARQSTLVAGRVEIKSSTLLQCERMRRFRREIFCRASRTHESNRFVQKSAESTSF